MMAKRVPHSVKLQITEGSPTLVVLGLLGSVIDGVLGLHCLLLLLPICEAASSH